jgi:hypothetical protein
MHEGEHVIGEASGIRVVLLDPQVGFMVQQAVENIGGVSYTELTTFELKGAY